MIKHTYEGVWIVQADPSIIVDKKNVDGKETPECKFHLDKTEVGSTIYTYWPSMVCGRYALGGYRASLSKRDANAACLVKIYKLRILANEIINANGYEVKHLGSAVDKINFELAYHYGFIESIHDTMIVFVAIQMYLNGYDFCPRFIAKGDTRIGYQTVFIGQTINSILRDAFDGKVICTFGDDTELTWDKSIRVIQDINNKLDKLELLSLLIGTNEPVVLKNHTMHMINTVWEINIVKVPSDLPEMIRESNTLLPLDITGASL